MDTFFELGKDKAAKGKGWALPLQKIRGVSRETNRSSVKRPLKETGIRYRFANFKMDKLNTCFFIRYTILGE